MLDDVDMPAVGEELLEDLKGTEAILVVDDDAMVRDVVSRMLREYGYTALEATDGMDAINVAGKYDAPIHLVLTDVVMPELTGRQLFFYLRGWYPSLRVLFMSGFSKGETAVKDFQDVVTAFIKKPFTQDDLVRKVRELLDTAPPPDDEISG